MPSDCEQRAYECHNNQKHQNEIKEEISEQSFDDESENPTDEIEDEEED